MLGAAAALLAVSLPACSTYCAPFGQNPGFTRAPTVEQVTLTSVRVSWAGTVTRIECADQFIVKSWNRRNPNDYMMSDLLPLDQFSYIVTDLVPNQDYVFQVRLQFPAGDKPPCFRLWPGRTRASWARTGTSRPKPTLRHKAQTPQ